MVTDLAATPGIGGLFRASALPWLAAGVGCIGFSVLCGVYRWRIFLGMQRAQISYPRALRISLIGMFFDLFFPGSAGGDTIRSLLVMREHPQRKAGAVLSVFMDHLSGFAALLASAALFTTASAGSLLARPVTAGLFTLLWGFLGFSVLGLAACLVTSRLARPERLRLPATFKKYLLEVHDSFALFTRRPLATLRAAGISFVMLFAHFCAFFCSARALGAELRIGELFAAAPIIEVVTMLPVSLSGLGIREKSYEYLLEAIAGVPQHIAALTSLGGFSCIVFWALVGGSLFAIYRSSRGC